MPAIDVHSEENWAGTYTMEPDSEFGTMDSHYETPPMSAPIAQKPYSQHSYGQPGSFHPSPFPSHGQLSRHSSDPYPPPSSGDDYSHTQTHVQTNDRFSERPMPDRSASNSFPPAYSMRADLRGDPRHTYSYPQHTFSTPDPNMHPESPPMASITPANNHHQGHPPAPRQASAVAHNTMNYSTPRRSFPETSSQGLPHISQPAHQSASLRPTGYPHSHSMGDPHSYRAPVAYGPDGHLNPIS
jgi:hypothetical protein